MATAGTGNQAHIIAVVGASGNGKGLYVKSWLRKTRGPILVWSPLEATDNYAAVIGGAVVTSIADLVAAIKAKKRRLVYVPNQSDIKAQFDRFCRVAWELTGWVIVVEELSRVTTPTWAPQAWKNLSTAGRHRGLTIIGTCQRPAQVDKDFFGNCSEIRCYAVGYVNDAKVMANTMFLDHKEILALPQFHYIHRDVRAKINAPGVVSVPKN
jgi:hypothetical protein